MRTLCVDTDQNKAQYHQLNMKEIKSEHLVSELQVNQGQLISHHCSMVSVKVCTDELFKKGFPVPGTDPEILIWVYGNVKV